MSGTLFASSGFDPKATSRPSGKPSPSVSGFEGSVPSRISSASVRPSPSLSMVLGEAPPNPPPFWLPTGMTAEISNGDDAPMPDAVFITEKTTLSASSGGAAAPPVFTTENSTLSASCGTDVVPIVFTNEKTPSASWGADEVPMKLAIEVVTLSASPATRQLRGGYMEWIQWVGASGDFDAVGEAVTIGIRVKGICTEENLLRVAETISIRIDVRGITVSRYGKAIGRRRKSAGTAGNIRCHQEPNLPEAFQRSYSG